MAMEWHKARLVDMIQETPQTRRFFFELPELERYDFVPGQFVNMELPIGEEPREKRRSYSIASRPVGDNRLEFIIVRLEGGRGTGYLFDGCEVGTEFPISSAAGRLVLEEPIEYDICYICTGTGVAPFRSQLQDIYHNKKPHQRIDLIFGTRTMEDVLYYEEFRQLEKDLPDFHYHVCLSREDVEGTRRGYVHSVYQELFADRHGDENVIFSLCGWGDMIKEARKHLTQEMGFVRKQVQLEIYG
jgi:CDP-4-dehydro-6-deoxyglucose reductase